MKRSTIRDENIQKAIIFLVKKFEESGDNEKPVTLHSIRVGMYLDSNEHFTKTIVAGILHDLLEDTKVERKEIETTFSEKIASLVEANSFGREIENFQERYKDVFERCLKAGREALLIKAADILDNSNYYHLAKDRDMKNRLIQKLNYFLEISEEEIGKEQVWKDLKSSHKELSKELKIE